MGNQALNHAARSSIRLKQECRQQSDNEVHSFPLYWS